MTKSSARRQKVSPVLKPEFYYALAFIGFSLLAFNFLGFSNIILSSIGIGAMLFSFVGITCKPNNQYHFCLLSMAISFFIGIVSISIFKPIGAPIKLYWQIVLLGALILLLLFANGLFSTKYSFKKTFNLSRIIACTFGLILSGSMYTYFSLN